MTRTLHVSEDILPLGEAKASLSRVLKQIRDGGRPVVITQNGRPAGVLVSPEDFDRLNERDRFIAAVEEGLSDVKAGRLWTDEELDRELERELPVGSNTDPSGS